MLGEIADSFEAVWHARTHLYEEVGRLRDQLNREEAATAELHDVAERIKADRDALLVELERKHAEVRELRAAIEQAEPALHDHTEQEHHSPEQTQLGEVTEELRKEQDRLLDEIRRGGAAAAEERKKLLEFLLDALEEVQRVPSNGLDATAGSDDVPKRGRRPRNAGRPPSASAPDDTKTVPPSQ